jgi:hypothetical protein
MARICEGKKVNARGEMQDARRKYEQESGRWDNLCALCFVPHETAQRTD